MYAKKKQKAKKTKKKLKKKKLKKNSHDEADLLGWLHSRARQYLRGEVRCKGYEFTGYESVVRIVLLGAERGALEQGG